MVTRAARHAKGRVARTLLLGALLAALGPGGSAWAAAPSIGAIWASSVQVNTVRLNAEVNPNGKPSSYHFDYITKAAYDANLAASKDGFTGASRQPAVSDTSIAGTAPTTIGPTLFGLSPATAYRYRLVVKNADGTTTSAPPNAFVTQATASFSLPDGRGWEMVSPVDKNGGQVDPPETLSSGGALQASADGQSVTFSSDASFATGAQGASLASQYMSSRGAGGWSTLNITPALISGSYGTGPEGVPYQLFSGDLSRGLLLNGRPCRGEGTECPVANPPLSGTDAPAGYQNYYLREGGAFEALLGVGDVAGRGLDPSDFGLSFAGASADLRHVVLSTCAALATGATDGCLTDSPNLYKWSAGSLSLANSATPGASLAARSGAVSSDGGRVYWLDEAGNLYLREGATNFAVGSGTFQTASASGSLAFYLDPSGHLRSYDAGSHTSADLTPAGGVTGVLGASEDGSYVYYATAGGIVLRHNATTTPVAAAVAPGNYPPSTGTARVSADGTKLLFVSTVALTTSDGAKYDNLDLNFKTPDSQVYLYDASGAGTLTCVSCNPTLARPIGASTIPGAIANGAAPDSTRSYKPRVLSADGRRVFFESRDAIAFSDTNLDSDVYQWEAQGKGSCSTAGGCISLISSGLPGRATFADASADGSDALFLTDRSLIGADPGSIDLYDARVGGGFPESGEPPPCIGDACQAVPAGPEDPVLTTVLVGPGNPAVRYRKDRLLTKAQRCRRKAKTQKQRRACAKQKQASARHNGRPAR